MRVYAFARLFSGRWRSKDARRGRGGRGGGEGGQLNLGLIQYSGPGYDNPLVQARLRNNVLVAIQNPAVTSIHASSQGWNDEDAVQLAHALRCAEACVGCKQHHLRVLLTDFR
jgi:hypothetical protein